jgi:hypothetical protein
MKKVNVNLNEYVRRLSDGDLSFLRARFVQNLCGDRADVLNLLSRDREIDRWLATAVGGDELFDMLETLGEHICDEYDRRDR